MIPRAALLAFAAAALAPASVRISIVEHGTERIIGSAITLAPVEVGSVVRLKFRVHADTQPLSLESITVAGAEFSAVSIPTLPILLAPGAFVDIDAEFRPALPGFGSGILTVNDLKVTIVTQALPAPVLRAGDGSLLRPGEPFLFGDVELGAQACRGFAVGNVSAQPVTIARLELAGSAFRASLPATPFILETGASQPFEIVFEPKSEGPNGAFLYLNSREFTLQGVAVMPEVPRPRLELDPASPRSGQQAEVAVRIESPARWDVEGVLRMEFEGPQDPAVRFLSGEGRALGFRIPAGESIARFGTAEAADFQTGSTAGRITFTAELRSYTERLTLDLPGAPVEFDSAEARRSVAAVEVYFTGFDNTRSASEVGFTFFDLGGRMIGGGAIRVDAQAGFRRHFDASDLGGVFGLRAVFPVRGAVSQIGSVEIEVVNSQGTTRRSVKMTE